MTTQRGLFVSVSVLSVGFILGFTGCASDAKDQPSNTESLNAAGIPTEQQAAFADGTVDLNEYQVAFGLFKDCANSSEELVVVGQTDPVSGYINYGVRGELSAPGNSNGSHLDDCYQRYFSYIEGSWQTTDPGALDQVIQQNIDFYRQVIQPCLEANGIDAPDEVVPGTEEFGELSRAFEDLNAGGKCPAT